MFHGASIGWGCALSDQCVAYSKPYSVTTDGAIAVGQATLNAIAWLATGVTSPSAIHAQARRVRVGELRVKGGMPPWVSSPHE